MNKKTCPVCKCGVRDSERLCPYCRTVLEASVPVQAEDPAEEDPRVEGYLIRDIENCMVQVEEDTIRRFRMAGDKPEFNQFAGFWGNLWFAKRGMLDVSLWILGVNMVVIPLVSLLYAYMNRGNRSLSYDVNLSYIFVAIVLLLEMYPLGKLGDKLFWNHIRTILDRYGCKDREDEADEELIKKLASEGGPFAGYGVIILGLNLLFFHYCKLITTAFFLYFAYTR